jgi:hypothetical protein
MVILHITVAVINVSTDTQDIKDTIVHHAQASESPRSSETVQTVQGRDRHHNPLGNLFIPCIMGMCTVVVIKAIKDTVDSYQP